jgi:hypothetical protein
MDAAHPTKANLKLHRILLAIMPPIMIAMTGRVTTHVPIVTARFGLMP